jgi:diacylglycerol kinase (ATP)
MFRHPSLITFFKEDPMPRMKLILNPASDRGRTAQVGETLQALLHARAEIEHQRGVHYELDWELTERPGQAVEITQHAAKDGYDIVVAVGGDGTVHEIVNGLMKVSEARRPKLGVLPAGSGNDFAHNMRLPARVEDCVHCLFNNTSRTIDVGLYKDDKGREEYWDNTIGLGFSGAVNMAARKITWIYGFPVYLIAVLQTIFTTHKRIAVDVTLDGKPIPRRKVTMISICNGPREGGGFPVAPHSIMDDGFLTYMFMRDTNRGQMLYFLPVVMTSSHLGYKRFFEQGNCKHIAIKADQTLAIHADGEIFGTWEEDVREVEMSIVPAAIQVMCNA